MKVRVGVIGVGNQGMSHVKRLLELDNAEVTTVYDANPETAARVAAEIGANAVDSYDAMMDTRRIDAVIICAPQFARDGMEETAARRGIHLLSEKPLGLDLAKVKEKARIIAESGIINAAGYCLRYYDTVIKAKAYLQGKPVHMVQVSRIGSAKGWPKWMLQQHLSGGNMIAGVTHQIDLVRFLGGEFTSVSAQFNRMEHPIKDPIDTIIDSGAATFTMANGSVGTISESTASTKFSDAEIKFVGYDFFLHLSRNGGTLTIVDENGTYTENATINAMYGQAKAFVDAVQNRDQSIVNSSFIDGVKTLEFTLASVQSSEEQRVIHL
ncbi:MAG: oxidoreductase [Paenibacillus sp.]|jgi:predicted dehydrogenase|nr:oxidoreductase [Paenibacillus sp.]